MRRLRGHATNPPGWWKEPGAFPATDHATPRTHQGRGRHRIRRCVRGQCQGRHGRGGSLIPHARAVRALVIAMIQTAFGTLTVALTRGLDRPVTSRRPTPGRAVRVAPIARRADRKEGVAASTTTLMKRRVHGVGAAVRSNWTYSPNRGTTGRTASACWSLRTSRGPGGSVRVRTLSPFSLRARSSPHQCPIDTEGARTPAPRPR